VKILFAGRSVYHFSYYDSILRQLYQKGHSLELLFDKGWSKQQPDEALQQFLSETGLNFEWGIRRKDIWRTPIFGVRELRSYAGYLSRKGQSEYYLNRWRKTLPHFLRDIFKIKPVRRLLRTKVVLTALDKFEKLVPSDKRIRSLLKEKKPDVLVSSPANLRFSEEIEYVKAAKALKIPTAIIVLSWDNLTTKGLFHVIPDLTLVWNSTNLKEAVDIHRVPDSRALIIGSPFFDKWFGADSLKMERAAFCQKIGIAPQKPFVVYLGSSLNIARDESWLVKEIIKSMRAHSDQAIREMTLVIRPHPANTRVYEQIQEDGVVVWPKGGALPESEDSQRDFYNTMYHCVAAMGINTSGMIDAIILNKPCISIMTDTYYKTQHEATHFSYLLKSGAIEVAGGADECLKIVGQILAHKDTKESARQDFIRSFVRPYGLEITAGEVAARAIELLGQGMKPEEVKEKVQNEFSGREDGNKTA
jgi:hypothetical protein